MYVCNYEMVLDRAEFKYFGCVFSKDDKINREFEYRIMKENKFNNSKLRKNQS